VSGATRRARLAALLSGQRRRGEEPRHDEGKNY